MYGTVYSIARIRIYESWNQEAEMGMFIITPSEWLGEFLIPIPATPL